MSFILDSYLQRIERLPMMPKVVMEIIRCIDDDDVGVDALVKQISSDVGLTASVLKIANTSRFSAHGGISSVHDAVMLVGFKQIRNMACMAGLMANSLQNNTPGFTYSEFWHRSVAVGVCASILAGQILNRQESSLKLKIKPDVAFIAGLLHDIGRIALLMVAPDDFAKTLQHSADQHCRVYEAEQAVLGFDHAMLGARLAQRWGFPQMICDAIEKHHEPDKLPSCYLADLLHVSEVLCCALELDDCETHVPALSEYAMFRLNMNFSQVQPYFAQIECEYHDLILMLE